MTWPNPPDLWWPSLMTTIGRSSPWPICWRRLATMFACTRACKSHPDRLMPTTSSNPARSANGHVDSRRPLCEAGIEGGDRGYRVAHAGVIPGTPCCVGNNEATFGACDRRSDGRCVTAAVVERRPLNLIARSRPNEAKPRRGIVERQLRDGACTNLEAVQRKSNASRSWS
jgi:hypothetical protein